jgi:DNA-binding NarL/FixJ family response regulator
MAIGGSGKTWQKDMIGEPTAQVSLGRTPIALGIIHSSALVRQGLERLVHHPDVRVDGLYTGAADVLSRRAEAASILLYDIGTAHEDGPEQVTRLHNEVPHARILMINVPDDDQAIIECVRVGAAGCILQDASLDDLLSAVHNLVAGTPLTSARVITSLFTYVAGKQRHPDSAPPVPLTPREEQILALMADALSNREIAKRLFLQPQTVKNYAHVIFQKLDVHDRLQFLRLIKPTKR